MIPLVVQNTIFNTSPFWASLLAYFMLKERITQCEIIAMVISFIGILIISSQALVADPTPFTPDEHTYGETRIGSYGLGCLLLLMTAIFYAVLFVYTRSL